MNNRTHRKLVVIDGTIGYIGGFNVGDEYLGENPKFGYWRDTHLRVTGTAVSAIQQRLVDHEMGSVGTANMDYRIFRFNFEVNAFFYDAELGGRLRDVYLDDLTLCTPFERSKAFGNRYTWAVKEGVSRLVSPLL